jgi:tetraacyldisaccharide 4'-kinase
MEAFFNRVWARRGMVAWLLWPLSLAYGGIVALRRALYAAGVLRSCKVPVPVVVVGNVRVGGGGKSPTALALVRHLHQRGWHVAVVSRGHGRSTHAPAVLEVRPDTPASDAGDEPLMLARQLTALRVPVFVGARRVAAAQAALTAYPATQVIVCDDGLQHLALQRDVEVVVHSASGVGNGFLLPAGPLREPWPRRADATLDTSACRRLADVAVDMAGRELGLDTLGSNPVVAVAAIANPQVFFDMLRDKGVQLAQTIALPDHDDFSGWAAVRAALPQDAKILCTEKDAVKLWALESQALAVPMILEPPKAFLVGVERKLAAVQAQGVADQAR